MKPRLTLVQPSARRGVTDAATSAGERPFETDYSGAFPGHAKSREGAVLAAMRHLVQDGYSKATVTDKRTGKVVARLSMDRNRKAVEVIVAKPFEDLR